MEEKIKILKEYFEKEESVLLAFLFGSRARNIQRKNADWDIGVYFTPYEYAEIDTEHTYPDENKVREKTEEILKGEVDFIVMNRAASPLVFSILNRGTPLIIKDRRLYLELLLRTSQEAFEYWKFTEEFYAIRERTKSLSEEDRSILRKYLVFLENEFQDLEKFKAYTWEDYFHNRDKRRNIERWVENLIMCAIDISKIILAGEKREIPDTYREAVYRFVKKFMDEESARIFSQFVWLRNVITHEYLDVKWEKIKKFIENAEPLFPVFIENVREFIKR